VRRRQGDGEGTLSHPLEKPFKKDGRKNGATDLHGVVCMKDVFL